LFVGSLWNPVRVARVGEVARISLVGRRLTRAGEPRPVPEIAGSALAEQLALGLALALVAGCLAVTLGVPALVWRLLAALAIVLVAALGVLAPLARVRA